MKRKILASLLTLLLVFSLVPTAVFAADEGDIAVEAAQTEEEGQAEEGSESTPPQ